MYGGDCQNNGSCELLTGERLVCVLIYCTFLSLYKKVPKKKAKECLGTLPDVALKRRNAKQSIPNINALVSKAGHKGCLYFGGYRGLTELF